MCPKSVCGPLNPCEASHQPLDQTDHESKLRIAPKCFFLAWGWISDVVVVGLGRATHGGVGQLHQVVSCHPATSTCLLCLNLMNFEQNFLNSNNFLVQVELGQLKT